LKHPTPPTGRLIALVALASLACATSAAAQTPTPTPNPIAVCANKLTKQGGGLRDYTDQALREFTDCALTRLDGGSCAPGLGNEDGDFVGAAAECDVGALDALCPLGADTLPEVTEALVGSVATTLKSQLAALIDDIFFAENDGCARPALPVGNDAYDCADKIVSAVARKDMVGRLEECFYSCELPRLSQSGLEFCADDLTGDPIKDSVAQCVTKPLESLDLLESRCTPAAIQALGCPLGAQSLTGLQSAIEDRVLAFVQGTNLGIFHSPCQGNLPGGLPAPVPADVTLLPSGTKKKLSCGQTIDGAFMGSDSTVTFDSDLDCSGATTATDGIVVATSVVTLNGRLKQFSIRGPQRSSLRSGVGIRLAPSASRVKIRNFKAIENFGVGIEDAEEGNNKKLVIIKSTVRRNVQAGVRLRSARVKIEEVTADKNGIGFDLSGDGTKLKNSFAKGSLYDPKEGIRLSGIDKNGNGSVILVSGRNTIELNQGVGIHVVEGAHVIVDNDIRSNGGAAILVDAMVVGNIIDTNRIKLNGQGIVVHGDGTVIDTNSVESSLGDGFVVGGLGNSLLSNSSGKKTDRGNGGHGFVISGQSVSVEDNAADANLGSGFLVTGTTTLFKGNTSEVNYQNGFDIQSAGHVFDSCSAEGNNVEAPKAPAEPFHEWVLVGGNSASGDNNSAGGKKIGIPAEGGFCDNGDDCRLPKD
jgi:hypothetical protein